jgi:tyrosyl-tRNA synthetase
MFLVHLLEGLDGEKMSKSKPGTAIWLTDAPDAMFGKVMAIKDDLMPHYFEWATEMPMVDVRATLDALARRDVSPRDVKAALATQIVSELHSPGAAEDAAKAFDRQFREKRAPEDMPTFAFARDGQQRVPIVEVLLRIGVPSKSEARRLLAQKGVRVNDVPADEATTVSTTEESVVRYGARKFARIRWTA